MSSTLKDQFKGIVKQHIYRDLIDDLMHWLESETDFYEAPASTMYHGAYAGGLVQHSLDLFECLTQELQFIYGSNWKAMYSMETVAIVSLFHDLCKVNTYELSTKNVKDSVTKQWHEERCYRRNSQFEMGHGALSVYYLQRYLLLSNDEAQAIFWHMGAYDISPYMTLNGLSQAFENNVLAFALHRADMMATYVVDNAKFLPAPQLP